MKLSHTVEIDDALKKAVNAFDYEFTGTSVTELADPTILPKRDGTWQIGLIVGSSGSGKSSLLKEAYGITDEPIWDKNKAIISQVSSDKLASTGLNSVPAWCRPYHILSNGEAFRARMARLLDTNTSFDEFTSVIDRSVAISCATAMSRYIRKENLNGIVFASCHRDIVQWLEPDWVFDTDTNSIELGRLRRPRIELEVYKAAPDSWRMFGKHHYLDGSLNKSSRQFVATWNGVPVAFASALAFPCGTIKNAWRGHRLVVLPEYQGLGIGVRLSDWVGKHFTSQGYRYFSKTAHPRLGEYRNNSSLWRGTSKNGKARKDYNPERITKEDKHKMKHSHRICYSHEFIK